MSDPTWALYHCFYARLAASIPIAGIVSITLPLASEHPLPAAIAAGYAALTWLRSLAQPEVPPEPVPETTSDSAGKLKAVAELHRHVCFQNVTAWESTWCTMDYKLVDRFVSLVLPKGATRDHPYIWPVGDTAAPLSALAVPPLLVNVTSIDPLWDRQVEYINAMRHAGKDVEVVLSPGMDHMFYLNLGVAEPTDEETAEHLVGAY